MALGELLQSLDQWEFDVFKVSDRGVTRAGEMCGSCMTRCCCITVHVLISHHARSLAQVSDMTDGHPLLFLGMALFKKYNLISTFRIDRRKLSNFLTSIEQGYHADLPYHNSIHAADVACTVSFWIQREWMKA